MGSRVSRNAKRMQTDSCLQHLQVLQLLTWADHAASVHLWQCVMRCSQHVAAWVLLLQAYSATCCHQVGL